MTDMNIDWARELLREAAAIYLAHAQPGEVSELLVDTFLMGGLEMVLRKLSEAAPVLSVSATLEEGWPGMPDLDGEDMFGYLPVAGDE